MLAAGQEGMALSRGFVMESKSWRRCWDGGLLRGVLGHRGSRNRQETQGKVEIVGENWGAMAWERVEIRAHCPNPWLSFDLSKKFTRMPPAHPLLHPNHITTRPTIFFFYEDFHASDTHFSMFDVHPHPSASDTDMANPHCVHASYVATSPLKSFLSPSIVGNR